MGRDTAGDRPPRLIRWFVWLFLTAFVVCGLAGIEAWPLTGFRLFSHLRYEHQTTWQAYTVAGGEERRAAFAKLPPGVRGFTLIMRAFGSLSLPRQAETCSEWARAIRTGGAAPFDSLRIYRIDWDLVPRANGRPARAPSRALIYECDATA